jgi:hypothetical protein
MKIYLLFLVIAGAILQSHAQQQGQPLIDSLLTQLPKVKEDTNKVMMLNDLSLTYYSINPDQGLKYGKQGLTLAEKLNWKRGMANSYKVIAGNYGYGKSDYTQALEYSFKSLQQFREIGDSTGTAKILGGIGVVYWFQASRMAHEIQNPLNFVNNSSAISKELVHDILSSQDEEDKKESASLLVENLEKINHHGKRAAGIIKQLQNHARAGTAQKFFEEEEN